MPGLRQSQPPAISLTFMSAVVQLHLRLAPQSKLQPHILHMRGAYLPIATAISPKFRTSRTH